MPSGNDICDEPENWLVWSVYHGAWWGPERSGYSTKVEGAGRYTRSEAIKLSRQRSLNHDGTSGEWPIPLDAVEETIRGRC